MAQSDAEHDSEGINSFLDVISNFVGILIILVMVVGERAKNYPPDLLPQSPASAELESARARAASLESESRDLERQRAIVDGELSTRTAERDRLSTVVAAIERGVSTRRAALDEQSRRRWDVDRQLAVERDELARLDAQRQAAETTAVPETIKIESYPTPISKTVDGKEAHFQLLGGRLVFIPFDILVDQLRGAVREQSWKTQDGGDISDTLGPVGGFRLRYAMQRHDTSRGSFMQVTYVEFIPTSAQMGETMDVALAAHSKFRDKLEMLSPRQYTITIWTYPDSFAEFRQLKKELYNLGYAVAARPLMTGMPIGASPHGSRSSAE
jgi:hypothetical protein